MIPISDLTRYLAIPHLRHGRDEAGADCLGLAILVLAREAGIVVREPADLWRAVANGVRDPAAILAASRAEAALWRPVTLAAVAAFDVIVFMVGRADAHVGVSLGGGDFLHSLTGCGVRCDHLDHRSQGRAAWRTRVARVYRHV
jgi:cell wall-associated NlpC family hydrolase